jgi:hypothetical protein
VSAKPSLAHRAPNAVCRGAACNAIRWALESADVEFIEENGSGPGVRLRKRQQKKLVGLAMSQGGDRMCLCLARTGIAKRTQFTNTLLLAATYRLFDRSNQCALVAASLATAVVAQRLRA